MFYHTVFISYMDLIQGRGHIGIFAKENEAVGDRGKDNGLLY